MRRIKTGTAFGPSFFMGAPMTCAKCQRDLPSDAFSPGLRDGASCRRLCRPCNCERVKAYRRARPDKVREYDRAYEQRRRDERLAKQAVRSAMRSGRLIRQPCAVCAASADVEAHHFSYAPQDWLSVIWLCPIHHKAVHSGEIDASLLPPTIGTPSKRSRSA